MKEHFDRLSISIRLFVGDVFRPIHLVAVFPDGEAGHGRGWGGTLLPVERFIRTM
jgi:hypothetical protein